MVPQRYLSLRHRRLTIEWRRLRAAAGLSRDEAAERMEWKPSKVTRIETGRWIQLSPRDIRDMCNAYGVTDRAQQDAYIQLSKEVRERGWWTQYADVARQYTAFEDEASKIQTFEPCYIPGLLQTEDYARALMEAMPGAPPDEVERRVEFRNERQKLLQGEHAPELWAIVDELAIRRPIGGEKVMREQLRHLMELVNHPNISMQVVPLSAGAHPGLEGSFVVLTFDHPLDEPIVFLEHGRDGLYLEEPEDIRRYTLMYDHLIASALSLRDSLELMREAIAEL